MKLAIKAWIYQKTGIYLAQKEELEYITSDSFWRRFRKIYMHKDNDMGMGNVQSLLIGSWQCEQGFYRAFRR